MKLTTFDAEVAGRTAAMDSTFNGEIPPDFERNKTLRDAWIDGYNSMAAAMDKRCYSPDLFKPARKARPPKAEVADTVEPPPAPPVKNMGAILEARIKEQIAN